MDNKTFDALSRAEQFAAVRELLAGVFGEAVVDGWISTHRPLIDNVIGHGEPNHVPGDAPEAMDNFWGGAWRIHHAD